MFSCHIQFRIRAIRFSSAKMNGDRELNGPDKFKELQKPPGPYDVRHEHCLGFGYDSSTDDYKVVMTGCQQGLVRAGLEIKEIEEVYSEEDGEAEEEEKHKEEQVLFHRQSLRALDVERYRDGDPTPHPTLRLSYNLSVMEGWCFWVKNC
ncbi:hypothetical protein Tco_0031836 [Tanacetum coccineum]